MEINGTEVGLGAGALVTTILTYFGLRSKKEDPMIAIQEEIRQIKGRQDRFEDALKLVVVTTNKDIAEINKDMTDIKKDVGLMSASLSSMAVSLARLNAFQELKPQ